MRLTVAALPKSGQPRGAGKGRGAPCSHKPRSGRSMRINGGCRRERAIDVPIRYTMAAPGVRAMPNTRSAITGSGVPCRLSGRGFRPARPPMLRCTGKRTTAPTLLTARNANPGTAGGGTAVMCGCVSLLPPRAPARMCPKTVAAARVTQRPAMAALTSTLVTAGAAIVAPATDTKDLRTPPVKGCVR